MQFKFETVITLRQLLFVMKALLAERNSSELEVQKEETQSLKSVVENLKDRIMSFEVTMLMLTRCRFHL